MSTDPRDRIEPGWRTDYKYLTCGPLFGPKVCGGELQYPPGVKIAQCPVCKLWTGRFTPYMGGTISGMCMTGGCEHCKYANTCDHECHECHTSGTPGDLDERLSSENFPTPAGGEHDAT